VISSRVQNGGDIRSVTQVQRFYNDKSTNYPGNIFFSEAGEDEVLEAVCSVRYNFEMPFPYNDSRSPYNIDEFDSTLATDSGLLPWLGEEQEAAYAEERENLDETIGEKLLQTSKQSEFAAFAHHIIGRDGRQPESSNIPVDEILYDSAVGFEPELGDEGTDDVEEVDGHSSLFGDDYPAGSLEEASYISDSENECPEKDNFEQSIVDKIDFQSDGGYSDGEDPEGFVDQEGYWPAHSQFQDANNEGLALAASYGTSQNQLCHSPYSMSPIPKPATFTTGSMVDSSAFFGPPIMQQQHASTTSFNPPPALQQLATYGLSTNPGNQITPPAPKVQSQRFRSNPKAAYKKGTDELLKVTLFNYNFLREYLGIFRPTEQLRKPWDYQAKLARYKLFSPAEKNHFHTYVKNIVDAEALADRQEEARKLGAASVASNRGMGGIYKSISYSGAVGSMGLGDEVFAQPIDHPQQALQGPFDVFEDNISTNAQLLHRYHTLLDESGSGTPSAPSQVGRKSNVPSQTRHNCGTQNSGSTFAVDNSIWDSADTDNMSFEQHHRPNSFLQGSTVIRNRAQQDCNLTFQGMYGNLPKELPRYAPNESMADTLSRNSSSYERKRKNVNDDIEADGDVSDGEPRASKRTRRVKRHLFKKHGEREDLRKSP
jgi:hypothetical protein